MLSSSVFFHGLGTAPASGSAVSPSLGYWLLATVITQGCNAAGAFVFLLLDDHIFCHLVSFLKLFLSLLFLSKYQLSLLAPITV